jgi:hypothetical protein
LGIEDDAFLLPVNEVRGGGQALRVMAAAHVASIGHVVGFAEPHHAWIFAACLIEGAVGHHDRIGRAGDEGSSVIAESQLEVLSLGAAIRPINHGQAVSHHDNRRVENAAFTDSPIRQQDRLGVAHNAVRLLHLKLGYILGVDRCAKAQGTD